jgi:thiol-disulfide isomerase/thioredoxin
MLLKKIAIILVASFMLLACSKQSELQTQLSEIGDLGKPKVFMIFAPDCPLCLNYADKFEDLHHDFGDEFEFYAILPGTYYSGSEVEEFLEITGMNQTIIYDTNWQLCKALGATVTPEFFVYSKSEIVYSGKCDDWAALIGRKRRKVSEHYLKDALMAVEQNTLIDPKSTQAVGCILEYKNE